MDKKCKKRQKTVKKKTERRGKNLNKENVQKQEITKVSAPDLLRADPDLGSDFFLYPYPDPDQGL
jgi:hypothetical protein